MCAFYNVAFFSYLKVLKMSRKSKLAHVFSSTKKFLSSDEISIESPMPELRNISRLNTPEEMNSETKKKVRW